MAPSPEPRLSDPGHPTGSGSGVRLEGGPVHDAVSDGLSVGLAIPIAGIEGLDFTAPLAGTRDGLSPSGTKGAAAAVAGFRLAFRRNAQSRSWSLNQAIRPISASAVCRSCSSSWPRRRSNASSTLARVWARTAMMKGKPKRVR